jgi:hypothetical protein
MSEPLQLTTEQQFEMVRIARNVERMSTSQLQDYVMALHHYHFAYMNTVKTVLSKDLSGFMSRP